MAWAFPHKWFRLAVALSLSLVAFQFAIDDAVHRTLCCSYEAFKIMAEALEAAPVVSPLTIIVLEGLALVSLFVIGNAVWSSIKKPSKARPFVVDTIFAIAVPVAMLLAWTNAMGHAETNWVYGYQRGLIAVIALWTITLFATRQQSANWKIRGIVYCVGVVLVIAVPAIMVNTHTWDLIEGEIYIEEDAESVRIAFGVLFASLFWAIDVLLSYYRIRSPRPVQ